MGAHLLHGNALEALQISVRCSRRAFRFLFDFIRLTDSDRLSELVSGVGRRRLRRHFIYNRTLTAGGRIASRSPLFARSVRTEMKDIVCARELVKDE